MGEEREKKGTQHFAFSSMVFKHAMQLFFFLFLLSSLALFLEEKSSSSSSRHLEGSKSFGDACTVADVAFVLHHVHILSWLN